MAFNEGENGGKTEENWGSIAAFMGDKLVIGLIWGDFKEVAIGDEILEVNGIKITEKDPCQLLIESLVSDEDADQMDLLIRTASGEEKTVVIRAI